MKVAPLVPARTRKITKLSENRLPASTCRKNSRANSSTRRMSASRECFTGEHFVGDVAFHAVECG